MKRARTGTEVGYSDYLERFPDGLYSEIAQNRLDQAEARRRDSAAALERDLWDEAREGDTVARYRAYLDRFPDGQFAPNAKQRIAQLDRAADPKLKQARAAETQLNLNPVTARLIEERLMALGHKPGTVDGNFDDRTRRAIRRYQSERELPSTGFLNEPTVVRLLADSVSDLLRR